MREHSASDSRAHCTIRSLRDPSTWIPLCPANWRAVADASPPPVLFVGYLPQAFPHSAAACPACSAPVRGESCQRPCPLSQSTLARPLPLGPGDSFPSTALQAKVQYPDHLDLNRAPVLTQARLARNAVVASRYSPARSGSGSLAGRSPVRHGIPEPPSHIPRPRSSPDMRGQE